MNASDPKSWGDKIVGFAVACLIAAVALYCAIEVLASILPILIAIGGVVAVIVAIVAIVRWRQSRW